LRRPLNSQLRVHVPAISMSLLEIFRVLNARQISFLGSLKGQRRNECGTDTRTILSRQDFNWVRLFRILLRRPVQYLTQSLGTASLEVRVLVEDRSVGPNVARLVAFLCSNCCDTTGGESSCAGSYQFGQATDELKFWVVRR
jgi:hypothetical protein